MRPDSVRIWGGVGCWDEGLSVLGESIGVNPSSGRYNASHLEVEGRGVLLMLFFNEHSV